jgi:hypothetical protein
MGSNWTHPVRPLADHLQCTDCHRAGPHDAAHPPPVPEGDYKAQGCYACHKLVEVERHWPSRHGETVLCRDCHPPHEPFAAALPVSLMNRGTNTVRLKAYDWQQSNELCLRCHSSSALVWPQSGAFVNPAGESYHELHLGRGRCLCIECHAPHGSVQAGLLRRELLDGQAFGVFPRAGGGNCTVTCHGVDHVSLSYGP